MLFLDELIESVPIANKLQAFPIIKDIIFIYNSF